MGDDLENTLFRFVDELNPHNNLIFKGVSKFDGIRVFLEEPIVDIVYCKWHGHLSRATQFISPVSNLFRNESNFSFFKSVQGGRNILNLYFLLFQWFQPNIVGFDNKLFRVGVMHFDYRARISWVMKFSKY